MSTIRCFLLLPFAAAMIALRPPSLFHCMKCHRRPLSSSSSLYEKSVNNSLQVSDFKMHVGVSPSNFKFSSNFLYVGTFLLGFQALPKAKERAWISWVPFQISTKHSFCSFRLAAPQQCAAEGLADWIKPFGRLAIIQVVLNSHGILPILDSLPVVAIPIRNPSIQGCCCKV